MFVWVFGFFLHKKGNNNEKKHTSNNLYPFKSLWKNEKVITSNRKSMSPVSRVPIISKPPFRSPVQL